MSKRICVVTGSRAEYHLLTPTLRRLRDSDHYDLGLVVTGSHLSQAFGETYRDIEKDGFGIARKIPILGSDEHGTPSDIDRAMARMLTGFDTYLSDAEPDLVLILGDRYEMLPVATAAMIHRIPIAHLHGGEKTEGALDESIRHAISKMATLHFTSCEEYRKRVIQLGENPSRVFNVGACGIENIKTVETLPKENLLTNVGLPVDAPFALVTYHPTTLGGDAEAEIAEVLTSLERLRERGFSLLITKANADAGGQAINDAIDRFVETRNNAVAFYSLGMVRYLSALRWCSTVIGNSSSGLLEAPSFGVPTVNIGDRQKGRVRASSVIDCPCESGAIDQAVGLALSPSFAAEASRTINPYGDGKVSSRIMDVLDRFFAGAADVGHDKDFYDIDFEVK